MARLAGADCGANLMERSYVLNGAGFTLVAKSNAIGTVRRVSLPFVLTFVSSQVLFQS
jgi:hypothetical protein